MKKFMMAALAALVTVAAAASLAASVADAREDAPSSECPSSEILGQEAA